MELHPHTSKAKYEINNRVLIVKIAFLYKKKKIKQNISKQKHSVCIL